VNALPHDVGAVKEERGRRLARRAEGRACARMHVNAIGGGVDQQQNALVVVMNGL
jgi:hypothetical protein